MNILMKKFYNNLNFSIHIKKERAELEIKKAREMSNIEINKLTEIIKAIGKDTIVAISKVN